jgi:hypothetical protein
MQHFKILYSVIRCTKLYAEARIESAQAVAPRLWTTRVSVSNGTGIL